MGERKEGGREGGRRNFVVGGKKLSLTVIHSPLPPLFSPPLSFLPPFSPLSLPPLPSLPFLPYIQGEYVAPEKIEMIYVRSVYVAQAYLYGDSLKAACVAIIVPDEEVLMKWATDNNITGSFAELCQKKVQGPFQLYMSAHTPGTSGQR